MPELIVRKWDGPYSFMVFREYGVYKARRGDTGEVQFEDPNKSVVIQNAINSLLQGGTIFLKEVQLPSGLTIPTNVLIVEDYQGVRSFYTSRDVYPPAVEVSSYIIFKDGGLFKAKNGDTGEVDFSGEDAASVMQSALDIARAIVIRGSGTYELSSPLKYQGWQWIVSPERPTLKGNFAEGVLQPKDPSAVTYGVRIENLNIDNTDRNTAGGIGIDLTNVNEARLIGVRVANAEVGFKITRFYCMLITCFAADVKTGILLEGNGNQILGGKVGPWDNVGVDITGSANLVQTSVENPSVVSGSIGFRISNYRNILLKPHVERADIAYQMLSDAYMTMVIAPSFSGNPTILDDNGHSTMWLTADGGTKIGRYGTANDVVKFIGDTTEMSKINAYGEYENLTAGRGIIVTTPDGTAKYRIRVDNTGAVVTEAV